jgi:hypothetical protein
MIVTERPKRASGCHAFTVNADSLYEPFADDFGPPSLAKIYKFCKLVEQKLKVCMYPTGPSIFCLCGPLWKWCFFVR